MGGGMGEGGGKGKEEHCGEREIESKKKRDLIGKTVRSILSHAPAVFFRSYKMLSLRHF